VVAFITLIALVVSVRYYIISRKHLIWDQVHRIDDRLYDIDHITIEYPQMRRFLYERWFEERSKPSKLQNQFFGPNTKHDDEYIRLKTFIYLYFNLFGELVSVVWGNKRMERAIEFDDWKRYIISKMQNPLVRELFNKEKYNFGQKLQRFVEQNMEEISKDRDPEIW
jgi:hypothetical protein